MPFTKVHLRKGTSVETRRAIADAIQETLIANLEIPEQDRFLTFIEYEEANFVRSPAFDTYGLTYTDALLMIEISFVAGRSDEVKKGLLADLNQRLVKAAGIRSDDAFVVMYDVAPTNVSFGQGLAQRAP